MNTQAIVPDDWCDYIEQDHKYDTNKVQMVISYEDLTPQVEAAVNDIVVMQDGCFVICDDNKLRRLPVNMQQTTEMIGATIQRILQDMPHD